MYIYMYINIYIYIYARVDPCIPCTSFFGCRKLARRGRHKHLARRGRHKHHWRGRGVTSVIGAEGASHAP